MTFIKKRPLAFIRALTAIARGRSPDHAGVRRKSLDGSVHADPESPKGNRLLTPKIPVPIHLRTKSKKEPAPGEFVQASTLLGKKLNVSILDGPGIWAGIHSQEDDCICHSRFNLLIRKWKGVCRDGEILSILKQRGIESQALVEFDRSIPIVCTNCTVS